MDTRLLCPWDFLGKSTGVGCHFLLQRIFPTQGSNPGLLHCRQTLYHLSHQGIVYLGLSLIWTVISWISLLLYLSWKQKRPRKLMASKKREGRDICNVYSSFLPRLSYPMPHGDRLTFPPFVSPASSWGIFFKVWLCRVLVAACEVFCCGARILQLCSGLVAQWPEGS